MHPLQRRLSLRRDDGALRHRPSRRDPALGQTYRHPQLRTPPPLLLNRRNLRVLESAIPSPPLNPAEPIGDHYTIDFPGDLLLLHTDGLAEARAPDWEFFPLAARVRRQPPTPPRELPTTLHRDLLRYSSGRLDDDIAALAVRLGKP